MDHRFNPVLIESPRELIKFQEIAFDEGGFGGDRCAMALAQIIVDDGLMAVRDQSLNNYAANITGSTRDKYLHNFEETPKR